VPASSNLTLWGSAIVRCHAALADVVAFGEDVHNAIPCPNCGPLKRQHLAKKGEPMLAHCTALLGCWRRNACPCRYGSSIVITESAIISLVGIVDLFSAGSFIA